MRREVYKVYSGGRIIRFGTLEQATEFCNEVHRKTGIILGIFKAWERQKPKKEKK